MSLRDQLQAIYDTRGILTPSVVVDEARDELHPLHSRFEWDDAVAGHKYREQQAHELIKSVKVSYRPAGGGEVREVRAFHAVRGANGHVYEPVDRVVGDAFTLRIVLQDMRREWNQLKARYERFSEFAEMVRGDIDAA